METVISPDKVSGHVIQKYTFKVLTSLEESGDKEGVTCSLQGTNDEATGEEESFVRSDPAVESDTDIPHKETGLTEEMLKKVDELSGELVKTQMMLEKQEEEYRARLESARQEGYDEGFEAGRQACMADIDKELEEMRHRLQESIDALAQSRDHLVKKVDTIEEELIETALDLAKQVVVKEIEKDSKEVALRLARLLLDEIKEAANITMKVNPEDYDYLKQHLEARDGVTIVPDAAVGKGGVVLLSDAGNIDANIMQRFERIKEAVFGPANREK